MSNDRRHTDIMELGWADFMSACVSDPFVRTEGHDIAKTHDAGRLVRFNLALRVLPETVYHSGAGLPRVHAQRLRRQGDLLIPTDDLFLVTWEELDWISWVPMLPPSGRRLKLTVTGQSHFGEWQVWEGGRVVHVATRRITDYDSHGAAVAAVLRLVGR